MTKEETYKLILDKSENNKIDLLTLYPIIDKACTEMQEIIDSKVDEITKVRKHDRSMRDYSHAFNGKLTKLKLDMATLLDVIVDKKDDELYHVDNNNKVSSQPSQIPYLFVRDYIKDSLSKADLKGGK